MTSDPSASAALTVVHVPDGCGNAPRKIVLRDFLIALYQRDIHAVVAALKDDIRWELIGSEILTGIDDVRNWLMSQPPVVELTINTVITHGTDCGADGSIVFQDGTTTGYSHLILFAGHSKTAQIKEIRSYFVDKTEG